MEDNEKNKCTLGSSQQELWITFIAQGLGCSQYNVINLWNELRGVKESWCLLLTFLTSILNINREVKCIISLKLSLSLSLFPSVRSEAKHSTLEERDVGSTCCPHFGQRERIIRAEWKIGDGDEGVF